MNKQNHFSYTLVLTILTLMLFACQPSGSLPGQITESPQVNDTYPGPDIDSEPGFFKPDSTYPGPALLSTLTSEEKPQPIKTAPQPQPGKASVSGLLFSFTSRIIIPETHAYFTPSLGENNEVPPAFTGPRTDLGDFDFRSDTAGNFELDNIPPGSYFLIVWAPYSWIPVINPEKDQVNPVLFTFEADKQYPLGVLELAWP